MFGKFASITLYKIFNRANLIKRFFKNFGKIVMKIVSCNILAKCYKTNKFNYAQACITNRQMYYLYEQFSYMNPVLQRYRD